MYSIFVITFIYTWLYNNSHKWRKWLNDWNDCEGGWGMWCVVWHTHISHSFTVWTCGGSSVLHEMNAQCFTWGWCFCGLAFLPPVWAYKYQWLEAGAVRRAVDGRWGVCCWWMGGKHHSLGQPKTLLVCYDAQQPGVLQQHLISEWQHSDQPGLCWKPALRSSRASVQHPAVSQ